ncbi:VanZ family protein [Salicibibacter cibarius]|uniref:VanZ family protein n=1 Tax=Salicibibacter cibarius TaxID=2743000 RepID=A0A7T6Z4Z9_9BACI|nr:VanZ family protein [Salicibibacter cibarius]QQK76481.1 VanZ family protein [Salicibibacter cibarius]
MKNLSKQKIVAWLLVIGWMGLIFYFSHQSGEASSSLSGGVTEVAYSWSQRLIPFVTIDFESFHTLIRKAAHVAVYVVLGIFAVHAFRVSTTERSTRQITLWAWLLCVCYAITDEVHQLFIPGRSGEVSDVVLDSIGALVGIGVYVVVRRKWSFRSVMTPLTGRK